jgi:hypothetical protein
MLRLVLVLAAVASCAVVDTLDGEIDDIENCCAALTRPRIEACMMRLGIEEHDDTEWTWWRTCPGVGTVVVYTPNGVPPGEHTPTPLPPQEPVGPEQ